jgi:hypothetical protein
MRFPSETWTLSVQKTFEKVSHFQSEKDRLDETGRKRRTYALKL